MLHVAQVSFYLDPLGRAPEELLRDWPSLVDVADAAHGAGVRVSVFQACAQAQSLLHHGVEYHFLAPEPRSPDLARSAEFAERLRLAEVDVLHVHGLRCPQDIAALAAIVPATPILIQDHANRVPRFWQRGAWRRAMSSAAAISFCARPQAEPFERARLFSPATRIVEIPESTSRFTPGDLAESRRATGMSGEPCVVWVGHLDRNKDPLTVLRGVSAASEQLPGLQLWCYFGNAPLMGAVEALLRADPRLAKRVHLKGQVAHPRIEQAMRAADIFVLGSHREGSGYSLLEAMACGVAPVVSDIPSFRALTGNGSVGKLWPCSDVERLRLALLATAAQPRQELRRAVRAHFDRELSFEALGRKLAQTYQQLSASR